MTGLADLAYEYSGDEVSKGAKENLKLLGELSRAGAQSVGGSAKRGGAKLKARAGNARSHAKHRMDQAREGYYVRAAKKGRQQGLEGGLKGPTERFGPTHPAVGGATQRAARAEGKAEAAVRGSAGAAGSHVKRNKAKYITGGVGLAGAGGGGAYLYGNRDRD